MDTKRFRVKENKVMVSSRQQEVISQRSKRESKKRKLEKNAKTKEEVMQARQDILEKDMDVIEECVEKGLFGPNLQQKLIQRATKLFSYKKDGYHTVTTEPNEVMFALVLLLPQ